MRIQSWKEARMLGKALKDWLASHCPTCQHKFSAACIDGGRCTSCGSRICASKNLSDLVVEAERGIHFDIRK